MTTFFPERHQEAHQTAPAPAHPLRHHPVVRITHWVGAAAMICMIMSGWQIYNASPLFPFLFPAWATLGGWLGAGIAWHIAAMWVLIGDGLIYLAFGILSGHFRRDLWPLSARDVALDLWAALRLRLGHDLSAYNAIQKAMYAGVILAAMLAVVTGVSMWKPVQLGWITALFGGYAVARYVHFSLMTAISLFVAVHVALVFLVPETIVAMLLGDRAAAREPQAHPVEAP
jgi:thiosulfate reductase cytochrome b subunit